MSTASLFPEYPIQQRDVRRAEWLQAKRDRQRGLSDAQRGLPLPIILPSMSPEAQIAALSPHFDGATYEPARDEKRLSGQLERVREAMSDGAWWTLDRLTARVGGTTPAVSARIRDLRKPRFGAHKVERKSLGHGLFAYRVVE